MSLDSAFPPDAAREDPGLDGAGAAEPPPTPDEEDAEEPVTTGTLFVMLVFLMALAGMWFLMYRVLLER